jgi:uncharacterized protein
LNQKEVIVMKNVKSLSLLMLIALSVTVNAQCYNNNTSNAVCVTGEAEVKVLPDQVQLILGIETVDRILKAAKSRNDEISKKALAVAKQLGIPAKQIQTDYLSVNPFHPDYRPNPTGEPMFTVRKTIAINLTDISKFEDLLSDLLEAGVTHIHGVDFRTSQLKKYRDEARINAVSAAQNKAEALAKGVGRKVGKAINIAEISYGYWGGYSSWWGGRWNAGQSQSSTQGGGATPLSEDGAIPLGQISIRATISVTFALE